MGVELGDLDLPVITIECLSVEAKRFAYFFFVPTLIYRDTFVRTRSIRYQFVLKNAVTFFILIFYIWSVFKALCIPVFKSSATQPNSIVGLRQFIHSVTSSTVSGAVCLLALFYGVLHCWFNIWAELFTFGDRLFYEDWWNVKDFANYYRKWNIVVHEFLYYYIYQDSIRFTKGMLNREYAKFLVFFISALIHEVVVTCALGFFYPVLFLMFGGPGVLLTRVKLGNGPYVGTLFWFLMLIGCGLLMVLISIEWFARMSPDALTIHKDGFWKALAP
jgi:sterol O-acyltransferase